MKKESRVLRSTNAFKKGVGVSTCAKTYCPNPLPASSLEMGEHFGEHSLEFTDKIKVTGKIYDLLEKLVKYPSGSDPRKDLGLSKGVYECAASCHANFLRLHQPVRNEAELRYSIADPNNIPDLFTFVVELFNNIPSCSP